MYNLGPARLAAALALLLDHHRLTLQEPDAVAAALVHFRKHPSLGFSDCLVLETARRAGHTPLGTFDRTLGNLPGAQKA